MISFYLQNGTTQVDYVVLSKYGIFAIETKKIVSTWTLMSANGCKRMQVIGWLSVNKRLQSFQMAIVSSIRFD